MKAVNAIAVAPDGRLWSPTARSSIPSELASRPDGPGPRRRLFELGGGAARHSGDRAACPRRLRCRRRAGRTGCALRRRQAGRAVTDSLPGYPSRISPAAGGGFWLTCFVLRTQLVEFVLREHAYRKRMLAEIEPQHWIAPALNSGNTFLEPMQGAQLKMMGVVKPWAPPRSYGLVIRLTEQGLVRYSLHSRFDGKHHGVVAAVECGGDLFVLAKGCRKILRLSVAGAERGLQS
jgi:hypothetical protein